MPLTRKVYKRPDGTRIVALPKTWCENVEEQTGKEMTEVFMEVNEIITLAPKLKEKEVEKNE